MPDDLFQTRLRHVTHHHLTLLAARRGARVACRGCIWPQAWTIAALPPPLDEWAGIIVVSIFGVLGVDRLRR